MTAVPDISVVIASFSGEVALRNCLESILSQTSTAEILVALDACAPAAQSLPSRFPGVRFLPAPPGTDVFQLRTRGISAAHAPLIALTEDHCTVSPHWLVALLEAFHDGHTIVGGPVENGLDRRLSDWALFCCEYLALLPPVSDGRTRVLSGVNVAYRRDALERCRATWAEAFYENEVHEALQRCGFAIHCASRALVVSHLQLPFGTALRSLYRGGERFGRHRQLHSSSARRWMWVLAAPAVPFMQLQRIVLTLRRRRPAKLGRLLLALPHILCLVGAWSAGEAAGYLHAARST